MLQFQLRQRLNVDPVEGRSRHIHPFDAGDRRYVAEIARSFRVFRRIHSVKIAYSIRKSNFVSALSMRRARRDEDVAVPCRIDDLLGDNRLRTELRLENRAAYDRRSGLRIRRVGDNGVGRPGVQKDLDIRFGDHLDEQVLIDFGVERRILTELAIHDSIRQAFQSLHHFFADTLGRLDFFTVFADPVSENMDDESSGREAAEVSVAFDERGFHAETRGGDCRAASGRSAADDENVRFANLRNVRRRTNDRAVGELFARRRLRAVEQLSRRFVFFSNEVGARDVFCGADSERCGSDPEPERLEHVAPR